jgi:formamidopyrimidine-DNA glycosylase
MPELPEVETIVRDLRPALVGRTIQHASLSHDDVLRGVSRRTLLSRLAGATVRAVERRAKHAVLRLDDRRLVVQPGMTGSLTVQRPPLPAQERRYAVLQAELDSGRVLVYHDVRRLGTLLLLDEKGWKRYDEALGPEPLDPALTDEAFARRLLHSRQAVKKLIMDQKVIVGVGNIYANEALFASGIDPSRGGNRIASAEAAVLLREIRRILSSAITSRGSTIRDYRTGMGDAGGFQLSHLVYGRGGEPCVRCGTRLTETHLIDARTSVFCHRCQS